MLCKICGTENSDATAFCENCGNPMHRPDPIPQLQYTAPQASSAPVPAGELPGKGLGIAGMVLGIVSIVFCCCINFVSFLCALIGLILSCVAMGKARSAARKNNFALAGLILSIIGLALSVFYLFLLLFSILSEYA